MLLKSNLSLCSASRLDINLTWSSTSDQVTVTIIYLYISRTLLAFSSVSIEVLGTSQRNNGYSSLGSSPFWYTKALHFPGNSVLPMFILLFTEEGHLADYTPFCYPTVFRDALFNLSLLLSKVLSAVRRNNFSTSSVYVFCIEFYFILEWVNLELTFFLHTCDFSLRVLCSTAGCSPSSTLEHSQ